MIKIYKFTFTNLYTSLAMMDETFYCIEKKVTHKIKSPAQKKTSGIVPRTTRHFGIQPSVGAQASLATPLREVAWGKGTKPPPEIRPLSLLGGYINLGVWEYRLH